MPANYLYCPLCLRAGILQPLSVVDGKNSCPPGPLGIGHGFDAHGYELTWEEIQEMAVKLIIASADKTDLGIAVTFALQGRKR